MEIESGMYDEKLTLLVVGYQRLGECLSDGVDLGDASTALDANPDVNIGETILAQEEDGLLKLVLESLGFDLLQRTAVHLDQALSALAVSDGGGSFLKEVDRRKC